MSTATMVLIGVLCGVLIFLVGLGGVLLANRSGSSSSASGSDSSTSSPSSSPSASASASDDGGTPADLASYYDQKLAWHACPTHEGDQCATLKVPLDYSDPGAKSIGLAVLKVPATNQSAKVGALVINPGGPGGSGVDFASYGSLAFGLQLPEYFDIVGFDPRGVGQSDPIKCGGTAELDKLVAADPDPDDTAEMKKGDELTKQFGATCLKDSGDLLKHVSTVEAAKDMDILRAALGEKKMYYFGFSYGTFLGAMYANLFPTKVARMVLDGAVDPMITTEQLSLQQAHGFETALRSYVGSCVDGGNCFLGDTVDAGTKRIRALLDQLDKTPMQTGSSRQLTEGLGMLGIWLPLYSKSLWPQLTSALKQAMQDDNGAGLLNLADQYTDRTATGYSDNETEALYAVNCLDHDDYVPSSKVPSYYAKFLKASPTFGKAFAYSMAACEYWPVQSHQSTYDLHAKGAPPIVVLGTTRDPATPLEWAKAVATMLDSGVLVTRNGDGHTAFNEGNSCIDNAVVAYLVKDVVPKNGLAC